VASPQFSDNMKLSNLSLLVALISSLFGESCAFVAFSTTVSSTTTIMKATTAAETTAQEEVKVGDAVPAVELKELTEEGGKPETISLRDLCAGQTVAIFGVPGAFTPGCSKSHLPSFIKAQDELKAKGVDLTLCVATNDAYTMEAWGRTSGGSAAGIRFLADDSGALTRALGLVMETPVGIRTKRFSLIAKDTVVTHYFSSAKESSDTWAPNVLAKL